MKFYYLRIFHHPTTKYFSTYSKLEYNFFQLNITFKTDFFNFFFFLISKWSLTRFLNSGICFSNESSWVKEYMKCFESVFDRMDRVLLKTFKFLSILVFAIHLNITVLTASFVSCCQPHPASPRNHDSCQEVIHLHLLRTHCVKGIALGTSQETVYMSSPLKISYN